MAGPTQEEIQEYFDNQGSFEGGDNGDPTPSFDPFSSGGISTLGPSGTALRKFKTLKAYLQSFFGPLPEGAVNYASGDLNKDGTNEVYAVNANGNPHTVYGYDDNNEVVSTVYTDYLRDTIHGGVAPQTWEEVERILRAEGYSDSEIASVENSLVKTGDYSEWLEFPENRGKEFGGIKYCHEVEQVFGNPMGDDCQTRGSINLGRLLAVEHGYGDEGFWDIRPTAGTGCTTSEGTAGITNPDGTCREDTTQLPGAFCPDGPHGSEGVLDEDGNCTFVEGKSCNPPENPSGYGEINSEGNCVEIGQGTSGGDCTIVTQENADECGFTIDDSGNLVDKDRGDEDGIAPFYTNCGGGIWSDQNTDCPDIDGVSDFCNDPANVNHPDCRPQTIEELIEEYGEAVVGTAQKVYDQVKGAIQDATDDPLGTLNDIITGGYMSDDERCLNSKGSYDRSTGTRRPNGHTDCTTAGNPEETGDVCWKDCVNASIFGGIPGLPGLPGNIDAGTYRDLENTIKEAGGTIQDILSAPTGNPNDPGFIERVKEWVIGKIDDIFGGVEDVTVDQITGWISTILDASVASIILTQTEGVKNSVTDKIDEIIFGFTDDGTEDSRCRDEEGNLTPWGERNPASCGEPVTFEESDLFGTGGLDSTVGCDEGTLDEKNNCICPDGEPEDQDGKCGSTTVDTEDTGDTERDPRCSNPAFAERNLSLCGGSTTFTESSGFGQVADDDCPEGTVVTSENAEVCGKIDCGGGVFVDKGEECPTTEDPDDTDGPDDSKCPEGTIITSENAEDCGYKECNGFYIPEEQECTVETDKCINGEEPDPQKGCPEDWCDDAMTIAPDEDGQCPSDPPLVECPDGSMVTSLDQCGTTTYTCPDPNATTNEDGSCGTCKTGYVYDGSVERCVQSTTPDPCLDAAYAAANPEQCGTGDDCVDCTCAEYAAANPEECATGPETPSGGGGGGGGGSTGGSGMFDLESFEIAGDPQLLARMEFPITNFLEGMFKDYV